MDLDLTVQEGLATQEGMNDQGVDLPVPGLDTQEGMDDQGVDLPVPGLDTQEGMDDQGQDLQDRQVHGFNIRPLDFQVPIREFWSPEHWEGGSQYTDDLMWEGCDWPEGSEYAGLGSEGVIEWPEEAGLF